MAILLPWYILNMGAAPLGAIVTPGLEFTFTDSRNHYTMPDFRVHYTFKPED